MKILSETTNAPSQKMNLVLENGEEAIFELIYKPTQQAWYWNLYQESTNFSSRGNKLVLSPNILRRYKNILNFGIQVLASDKVEPFHINDFITDRVAILTLNKQEVEAIEASIYGVG